MRKLLCLFFLLCAVSQLHAQQRLTKQQEKNLIAFARLYGYTRYFHPSDEAQQIFWPMFVLKGSQQMLAVQSDKELIQALNGLFQPLGPTIRIFPTSQRLQFDPAALQPPATAGTTRVISWQHQGLYTGTVNAFHNVRLNRPAEEVGSKNELTYDFLKDVDVSHFAGLPYEVDLTVSERGKSKSDGNGFALAFHQLLAGQEDSSATQHFLHQQLTTSSKSYTFTGELGATAKRLDVVVKFPNTDSFALNFTIKAFVLLEGKKIALPKTASVAGQPTTKQRLEVQFSSANPLAEPLFAEQLHLGDYVAREVAPGISCLIPLALAGDAAHTYPVGDSLQLQHLGVRLADWKRPSAKGGEYYNSSSSLVAPETRLATIVLAWNALRHGYAYWQSASVTPDALLRQSLRQAYQAATPLASYQALQRMLAPLNDGHGFVFGFSHHPDSLSVPLYFGKAEGNIVVTRVLEPALTSHVLPGDIVLAIDGVPAKKILRERASLISGSPQRKEYGALVQLLNGPATQGLDVRLRRGSTTWHMKLPRTVAAESYREGSQITAQRANGWLAPGIYYYNLATLKATLSPAEYQTLAQAKAVIFDIRNYPNTSLYSLIPLLLNTPGKVSLFSSLNMLRPDQEDVRYAPGADYYKPAPQHLPGKIYFLTDAVTQSLPEGFLGAVRGLQLGTLVGRPTSGANGVVNTVVLPGGCTISYSGMRVKNADGSRHHAIGIQPDVLVTPTLESVRKQQDLTLETALRLASDEKLGTP